MSTIQFPDESLLRKLAASKRLDEALQMFANIVAAEPAQKCVPDVCRDWLRCCDAGVAKHKQLRRAVFHAVFSRRVLSNASVETYWDVACRFGPSNQTVVIDYLVAAPKSVPLKLGRLLLAKAEFGVKPMSLAELQQVLAVLFAVPAISQGVISRDWLRELSGIRSAEAELMAKMGATYAADGPVYSLIAVFPQISANQAHMLLAKTGESVEQLTQKMLDIPDFASATLNESKAEAARPKKYVLLDDNEKQRRADALRQKRRLEFSYKYTAPDEEDPDPEAEDTVQQEFSEADKKLVAQEQLLWSYWHSHRDVFDRQSRKSDVRKALKTKLKWTDEQIEGWGRVSARSSAENGKHTFNVPRHFKEVEAYAPAFRHGDDVTQTQPASQGSQTDASSMAELQQRPANSDRQKNTRHKKDAGKLGAPSKQQTNEKGETKPKKSAQQKRQPRKSGKGKSTPEE